MGYLASVNEVNFEILRKAVIYGSVMASFNVEAFSLSRLKALKQSDIVERYTAFKIISHFDDIDF